MATVDKARHQNRTNSLLVALALTSLLMPAYVYAAERESTALFFSFEDLKQALSHPDFSPLYPNFSWQSLRERPDPEGPIERNYRWGNGLGFDGYSTPRVRRPLWGN